MTSSHNSFRYSREVGGLLLAILLAVPAHAESGKFGSFTNSDGVGAPALKGAVAFDPATWAI
jgi:hypothetical protein